MQRFLVLSSLIALAAAGTTFHSITIDGKNDFSNNEAIIVDESNDSYWSSLNELDTLFLTWNKDTLFIGCAYHLDNNALLIFLDTGDGGIDNANELDWYPRDVKFSGVKPDYLIALWNCDLSLGGVRKLGENTTPIPFRGINKGNPGEKNFLELGIALKDIGSPEKISLTALICGGDYSGAGDVMPDDPSVRGSGSAVINIFTEVTIDGNGDSIPDDSIPPMEVSNIKEYPVTFPEFTSIKITPSIANKSPVIINAKLSDTSTIFVSLFTEKGKFYERIVDGVTTDSLSYQWNIDDLKKGIYILKFYTSENRGMVKRAFVRY